jgi:hypothetical protein
MQVRRQMTNKKSTKRRQVIMTKVKMKAANPTRTMKKPIAMKILILIE